MAQEVTSGHEEKMKGWQPWLAIRKLMLDERGRILRVVSLEGDEKRKGKAPREKLTRGAFFPDPQNSISNLASTNEKEWLSGLST
jgi:hypothetical protein